MRNGLRAAAVALPLAAAMLLGSQAARAGDDTGGCFFNKTDVLGQLVPQAAETAWVTGSSAATVSKSLPGQFATATAPVIEVVGLVNSDGSVFALGFDGGGCAFVGDSITLAAFNAALATVGHDPLPVPKKVPMQA